MPIKNVVKQVIQDEGIVIYNRFKKATDSFQAQDGRTVPATQDRYVIGVVCGKLDPVLGFSESVVLEEFKIMDEKEAKKYKYLSPIVATFEATSYGVKPISLELKK